jgi:hypothetical protein
MNEPYPMREEWTKDLFKIGDLGFQASRTTFFLATRNIRPEYSRLLGSPFTRKLDTVLVPPGNPVVHLLHDHR